MEVAPRGKPSSAATTSRASLVSSIPNARRMQATSLPESWIITWIQCTSSTYGLPRILQNPVAVSIALIAVGFRRPKSAARLISVMSSPL